MAIKIFKRGNPGCTCCPTGGRGLLANPVHLNIWSTDASAERGNLPLVLGDSRQIQVLEETAGLGINSYAVGVDMESLKIIIADGSDSLGWTFYKIAHPWTAVEQWITAGTDLETFTYDASVAWVRHWPSSGYVCVVSVQPGSPTLEVASFDDSGNLQNGPYDASTFSPFGLSVAVVGMDESANVYTVSNDLANPKDNLYQNGVLFGQAPYDTRTMWHDGTDLYASASVVYDGDVPQYGVWRIVSGGEPVFVQGTGEIFQQLAGLGLDEQTLEYDYYDYTEDSCWFDGWYAAPGFLGEDGKGILVMPGRGVPSFE